MGYSETIRANGRPHSGQGVEYRDGAYCHEASTGIVRHVRKKGAPWYFGYREFATDALLVYDYHPGESYQLGQRYPNDTPEIDDLRAYLVFPGEVRVEVDPAWLMDAIDVSEAGLVAHAARNYYEEDAR